MTIENVLIIDTETTGLYPEKGAKVIEVGAILYNVPTRSILQNFSTLFPCEENPVQDVNGISADSTRKPMPFEVANRQLELMAEYSDAMIAHNAEFDRKFLKTLSVWTVMSHLPLICTKADFKWPCQLYRNRLQDVCEGMGVPYVDAHRALNDCRFLALCFSKVVNLEQRLDIALNQMAKSVGFQAKGNQYV